jgi:ATP-dependent exoDNAse (exonuclease V) beta subunit
MKWNKLYKYPPSTRSLIEGNRHYDVSNEILPSVTTILQNTQSDEKKASLSNWRQKVGENEANRIRDEAARRGTAMHEFLEMYLHGEKLLDLRSEGQAARGMAREIIEQGLKELKEVWGSEVTLFYPGLYAGQTDLCGIYTGRESIIDFKQTNRPKKKEWVEDYFLQLAAYAMAHDVIYGTCIDQGVILMCSKDGFFQKFTSNGADFTRFKHKFLGRIDLFYQKK